MVTDSSHTVNGRLLHLADTAVEEAKALRAALPGAAEVRYDRSPASNGVRDKTGRRAKGGHSDPTADVATDPARLDLSHVLTRAEAHLADAVIRLRGVRRAVEIALARWEGADK